jgi:putative oxidoreductase
MRGPWDVDPAWGITIVRIMMAIVFIVSGYGKWAGGMTATATGFAKAEIPAAAIAAPLIATLELGGGPGAPGI